MFSSMAPSIAEPTTRGLIYYDALSDIDPFVLALHGESHYAAVYPECGHARADLDCNGTVDFDDIDGFVDCLIGSCACT